MNITAIRLRKLISTPIGYGHHAAEIEAHVGPDDDAGAVAATLHAELDAQLATAQGREAKRLDILEMEREAEYLKLRVEGLAAQRDDLQAQVRRNRDIIGQHEEINTLARERGLDPHGLPDEEMPF